MNLNKCLPLACMVSFILDQGETPVFPRGWDSWGKGFYSTKDSQGGTRCPSSEGCRAPSPFAALTRKVAKAGTGWRGELPFPHLPASPCLLCLFLLSYLAATPSSHQFRDMIIRSGRKCPTDCYRKGDSVSSDAVVWNLI